METQALVYEGEIDLQSFNFLASLINGNIRRVKQFENSSSFNFLASLINGNPKNTRFTRIRKFF